MVSVSDDSMMMQTSKNICYVK